MPISMIYFTNFPTTFLILHFEIVTFLFIYNLCHTLFKLFLVQTKLYIFLFILIRHILRKKENLNPEMKTDEYETKTDELETKVRAG